MSVLGTREEVCAEGAQAKRLARCGEALSTQLSLGLPQAAIRVGPLPLPRLLKRSFLKEPAQKGVGAVAISEGNSPTSLPGAPQTH